MMALDLEAASSAFAGEVSETLDGVLAGDRIIVSERFQDTGRFVVKPDGEDASRHIALTVDGQYIADLDVAFYLTLDHTNDFLKAVRSDLKLYLAADGIPLVRLEYRSDMNNVPVAHWHIHTGRDRFAPVLDAASAAGRGRERRQRDLSAMHLSCRRRTLPARLEDFLEYLIRELGIDARAGWEDAIKKGRETWRLRQLRAAVRDSPAQAAQVLKCLQWAISPPSIAPLDNYEPRQRW
jgi:hypothetical protein